MRRVTRSTQRYSPVVLSTASVPKVVRAPKRRKVAETAEEAMVVAQNMDWTGNFPMISGNASGLYNLSSGTKEYKFVDVSLGASGSSTTLVTGGAATFVLLNGLKQGTSAFNRIGNKIAMKSLYWGLNFALSSADVDPATDTNVNNVPVRCMIVYDKQTNGVAPVMTDFIDTADASAQLNLNKRSRCQVFAGERFHLGANGTIELATGGSVINVFRKLNVDTQYSGTGATVTSIASGALWMVTIGDAAAASPNPTFRLSTRVRFVE